ncbi:MAG: trypsin-like peptidase domain-containing protein [Succinivibrionaceae bacterium]|nr:trypsin-like peptidase domain-containing protein [Succinivibrionaceae bacterium]
MKLKKALFFTLPTLAGIAAGVGVLCYNPKAGSGIGDFLYSSGVDRQSYAYGVSRAAPSVVNIYVSELPSDYSTAGSQSLDNITMSASGVIMSRSGYIVTNYHVIPSAGERDKAVWAQTRDGKVYQAMTVGYDRRTDIAVLKIEGGNTLPPIPRGGKHEVQVGDVVLAIGNPNNLGQTVTHGIVSATARTGSGLLTHEQMNIREGLQDLIQTDAPINVGNSGGALVNTSGELIGINTASFNSQQYGTYGIGFAVPTRLVEHVMDEIIKHGRVIRGYLGISDDGTTSISDSGEVGIKVGYVDPDGPASPAGVRVGDVIISANGHGMRKLRDLIDIISSSSPGTEIKITVQRGGKVLEIPVTLEEDKTDFPYESSPSR